MPQFTKSDLLETIRYRQLVVNLVLRDLKVRYRRSWLGFGWSMLHPLLMVVVIYVVFSHVFGRYVDHYGAYVIVGVLAWQLIAQSTARSTRIFAENAGIIKKAYMPLAVFPLAAVFSAVINFSFAILPVAALLLFTGVPLQGSVVWLPLCMLLTTVFIFGVALVLATVSVYFQDVVHMYEVVLLIVMYLSAIFYPPNILPEQYQGWLQANPVFHFINLYRACIYDDSVSFGYYLFSSSALAVAALALGVFVYGRHRLKIVYHL